MLIPSYDLLEHRHIGDITTINILPLYYIYQ